MNFKLVQKAKKTGGDKYICEQDENFNIYFPQEFSRINGECKEVLKFNYKLDESLKLKFKLSQKAKKTGSDKYICEENENFSIYIPQNISRNNDKCYDVLSIEIT